MWSWSYFPSLSPCSCGVPGTHCSWLAQYRKGKDRGWMAQTRKQQRNWDLFTLLWLFPTKNLKPSPCHVSHAQACPALAIPMGLNCSQLPKKFLSTQILGAAFGVWPVQNSHLGSGEAPAVLGLCQPFGDMAWLQPECGHSLGQLQVTAALRITQEREITGIRTPGARELWKFHLWWKFSLVRNMSWKSPGNEDITTSLITESHF